MSEGSTDWRERSYFDRIRLLDEIHRRSPQAIGPVARVSFMSRVFPTLEEEFTQALGLPENRRKLDAANARETVDKLLEGAQRTKTIKALTEIMAKVNAGRSQRHKADAAAAEERIAALRNARWHGAGVDPPDKADASGAQLNWTRGDAPDALRITWELFSNNQNFTMVEDLRGKSPDDASGLHDLVSRTALTSALEINPAPRWVGDLLLLSHYWIVPLAWVLREEPGLDTAKVLELTGSADPYATSWHAEHRTAFRAMARYARSFFGPPEAPRDDFVFTAIADGRAFLLSDLRAHGGEDGGMAFRTLILDGGPSPEQRGRIVRYATDIEAYRTLSLRGYLLNPIFDNALDRLSLELKTVESEILVKPQAQVDRLQSISSTLSVLNFFLTHGISGRQLTSSTFGKLTSSRTDSLRERRIPGYSTLSSFLRNFHGSLGNMDRVAQRYDILRRRITEAADLIRAELQLGMARHQVWWTGVAAALAVIALIGGMLWDVSPEAKAQVRSVLDAIGTLFNWR